MAFSCLSGDYKNAAELGLYVGGDGEGTTKYLAWVAHRARTFFNNPHSWAAVERVAAALLERKSLAGREAREAWLGPEGVTFEARMREVGVRMREKRLAGRRPVTSGG